MARPEGSRAEKPHKAENIRLGCFLPDSHHTANAGERQGRMGPTPRRTARCPSWPAPGQGSLQRSALLPNSVLSFLPELSAEERPSVR